MGRKLSSQNSSSRYSMKSLGKQFSWFYQLLLPLRNRVKVREGRIGEVTEILAWYEFINDIILDHLDDEIKSTDQSGVWRYLISFKVKKFKEKFFFYMFIFSCSRIFWGPSKTSELSLFMELDISLPEMSLNKIS